MPKADPEKVGDLFFRFSIEFLFSFFFISVKKSEKKYYFLANFAPSLDPPMIVRIASYEIIAWVCAQVVRKRTPPFQVVAERGISKKRQNW